MLSVNDLIGSECDSVHGNETSSGKKAQVWRLIIRLTLPPARTVGARAAAGEKIESSTGN